MFKTEMILQKQGVLRGDKIEPKNSDPAGCVGCSFRGLFAGHLAFADRLVGASGVNVGDGSGAFSIRGPNHRPKKT
jgi:hypothetical protein